jgi:two-component system phosphate regulon response regulator PhoB
VARILVVDDDADIRDMLSFKLANAGFDVHTEEDGETGLAAARELHPDLVVLDWMMPRMTGPEVCEALRQEPESARVPVILLTAKAQEADVQRGFATGADDYVCKPFSPRELVSRVQALIGRVG